MVVPTTSSSGTICTSKKLLEPRHDGVHCAVACFGMTVFSKGVWCTTEIKEYGMVKKRIFLSLFLLCVVSIPSLTAVDMAQSHERIWILNELDEPISIYCEFQYEGDIVFQEYWPQLLAGRDVLCYTLFDGGTWESYKAGARIKLIDYTSDALLISEEFSDTMRILPEIPLEQKLKELFKTLVITDAEGKVLLTLDDFSKARVEVGPNGRTYDIIIGHYLYQ